MIDVREKKDRDALNGVTSVTISLVGLVGQLFTFLTFYHLVKISQKTTKNSLFPPPSWSAILSKEERKLFQFLASI